MADEIRPALTPEEWSECVVTLGENSRLHYKPGVAMAVQARGLAEPIVKFAGESTVKVMALANAALPDDDPRKITRQDASLLQLVGGGYAGDPYQGMSDAERQRAIQTLHTDLLRLAAKLAALLPQEA